MLSLPIECFVFLTSDERDVFQRFVYQYDGCRDPQYRLPFLPVQWCNLEQGLHKGDIDVGSA